MFIPIPISHHYQKHLVDFHLMGRYDKGLMEVDIIQLMCCLLDLRQLLQIGMALVAQHMNWGMATSFTPFSLMSFEFKVYILRQVCIILKVIKVTAECTIHRSWKKYEDYYRCPPSENAHCLPVSSCDISKSQI